MKFLVTWKSIAFPDMDLQTCVKAEAEAPEDFKEVYYADDVKEVQ